MPGTLCSIPAECHHFTFLLFATSITTPQDAHKSLVLQSVEWLTEHEMFVTAHNWNLINPKRGIFNIT